MYDDDGDTTFGSPMAGTTLIAGHNGSSHDITRPENSLFFFLSGSVGPAHHDFSGPDKKTAGPVNILSLMTSMLHTLLYYSAAVVFFMNAIAYPTN